MFCSFCFERICCCCFSLRWFCVDVFVFFLVSSRCLFFCEQNILLFVAFAFVRCLGPTDGYSRGIRLCMPVFFLCVFFRIFAGSFKLFCLARLMSWVTRMFMVLILRMVPVLYAYVRVRTKKKSGASVPAHNF